MLRQGRDRRQATIAARTGSSVDSRILRLEDVQKVYRTVEGEPLTALENISFDVERGSFVSLVGPSGCGKTTLLLICAGLRPATGGTVHFADVGGPVQPGTFGMVFQSPALLPWRTIIDNVLYPADILHMKKGPARERARSLLKLMQLDDVEGKYPSELSGGMQQRVSIARALLHDPEILFMDEPFGALDAMTRDELNMELQRVQMAQQKTVLFVTHSIREAVLLSDRVIVMSARPGRVASDVVVPLDRPRTMETVRESEFLESEARIREALESHPKVDHG
jgi:NitT/TauT family transport system ATP-binding protein